MNDPAGLLYHNEVYHMFFQYNPGGIQWGNMSWGHATSKDLSHWEEQPIAFLARGFPDNITEMFFTGSAVADVNNTSGFGTDGKIPLVAVYTSFVSLQEPHPLGDLPSAVVKLAPSFSMIHGLTHLLPVSRQSNIAKRELHSSQSTIPVSGIQPR
jgi:hypothetical protein